MKKTLFIFLTLVTISLQSIAGEIKIINQGSTFSILYRSGLVCDTKISILDSDGNVVFKEMIHDMCNIIRSYNFSKLPYGDYEIKASNEFETRRTKVSYYEPIPATANPLFHVTKLSDNRYLLTIPKSGGERINISISGDNTGLLYEKIRSSKEDFACVYKIQHADPTEKIEFSVRSVK